MKTYLPFFIFIFILIGISTTAQNKSGNVWVMGGGAMLVKFTDTSKPVNSQLFPNISGRLFALASSVICDSASGALLAMCNGYVLYDSVGNIMDGGDSLVPSKIFHHNPAPNGQATQGSIILPKGSTGLFYVITPTITDSMYDFWTNNPQFQKAPFDLLQYHIFDMNANGGLGKVIQKDIPLLIMCMEQLSALLLSIPFVADTK